MQKISNNIFINRCKVLHNNYYDYSKTFYIKNRNKVIITCPIHGDFLFSPKNHLKGQGCYKCGIINREKLRKRITNEEFIKRCNIIHKNKYDYTNTFFTQMRDKINIICPIHGNFNIQAQNHVSGQNCKECSIDCCIFKKSEWVKKAKSRKGIFYIIKCWKNEEVFYKLGITYRSVKTRYNNHNMPYNFEIVKEVVSDDLEYIWDLEKRFKKFKLKTKYLPKIKFPGSKYECFK